MTLQGDEVRNLNREIRRLWQEIAKRPHKVRGAITTHINFLRIIDGVTVFSSGGTTVYGGTRKSGTMTQVASIWDPNGVGSTAGLFTAETGICRAALIIDGVEQSSLVLVCHDSRSGSNISQALVNGDRVCTVGTVNLTLVSDATQSVTAYLPLYM